ncbi:IS3 family transposase [Treponema phagedenis]|uniref:IS3 family transposase n=1 Tax=Treponema phagedenis TaxID=162 RepID=UPI002090B46B|nr:IS3 family transposase [Treponema phagedenis]
MESFFATLKKELLYRIDTTKMMREQVKTLVWQYTMVYYNRKRISTVALLLAVPKRLNYKTPHDVYRSEVIFQFVVVGQSRGGVLCLFQTARVA